MAAATAVLVNSKTHITAVAIQRWYREKQGLTDFFLLFLLLNILFSTFTHQSHKFFEHFFFFESIQMLSMSKALHWTSNNKNNK